MTGAETKAKLDAEFAAAKLKSIDTLKPDKVASLVHVVAVVYQEGQVGPGFTNKDLGQLKNLIKSGLKVRHPRYCSSC